MIPEHFLCLSSVTCFLFCTLGLPLLYSEGTVARIPIADFSSYSGNYDQGIRASGRYSGGRVGKKARRPILPGPQGRSLPAVNASVAVMSCVADMSNTFLRGCEAIRVRNWDEFVCLFVFFFSSW